MLSVPLMLFRGGGDASLGAEIRVLTARSKAPTKLASGDWLGQFLVGLSAHLAALRKHKTLSMNGAEAIAARSYRQKGAVRRSGDDSQERPASSPCPSSSNSDESSASSSSDSSDSSNSSSDSEDEAPPPSANGNSGGGNGGDDQRKKDDDDDGNSSDSSSSDSSTDESDQEEDDGVMIDTDDEKDKTHNGVDPTDEDISGESDGSSDLENSYPQLPSAPVDTLIAFRQQAAQKELQLTEKLKKDVIADARQRHQERQRSKKKKTSQSKRRHSKQNDVMLNGSAHYTNGSTTNVKMASQGQEAEDEWMVDCSCGLKEKNYDDGTSMIQCDSCSHWVHAKCADKQPEAVAQEKFMCFRCSWMFDCVCEIRRRPNHDDGQRMVECESCKTWQHTMCVGIPMNEEPADNYRCPRCMKKARRRKSASKGGVSRDRQRKQSNSDQSDQSRHRRKSSDASPMVAVDVRSAARSIDTLTTPTRAHRSRRAEPKESPKKERKAPLAHAPSPPPVPEASPPSSPPPPPPSPPPPSGVKSGSAKHDRSLGRLRRSERERERERSSASSSSPHRKRGRSLGTSPSSSKQPSQSESNDVEHQAPPPTGVTPSPRGKGLMLRGYSPASARTDTPSSRTMDVRPPIPLTPGGSSGHSYNNHSNGGRKRRGSSARDRLAKKLKIKKSSLR